MKKERKELPIVDIELNEGQLDWLPKNPRMWTQADIDKTAISIREDPDFLEDRPILVVPFEDTFIAFAGNLRHEGCKKEGRAAAPCIIYYPETEDDRLVVKRRAMKDNGSFGSWDYDELANSWDDLPLTDWGVPAWERPKEIERKSESRAAGHDDVDTGAFTYAIRVECPTSEEQFALLEELQQRGYSASVV